MKAILKRDGAVNVIEISGVIDIGRAQAFKEMVKKELSKGPVVFNLEKTVFVGSNGIQTLLSTFKFFSDHNEMGLKLVGVKPELKRLLGNMEFSKLGFYESDTQAIQAFVVEPEA